MRNILPVIAVKILVGGMFVSTFVAMMAFSDKSGSPFEMAQALPAKMTVASVTPFNYFDATFPTSLDDPADTAAVDGWPMDEDGFDATCIDGGSAPTGAPLIEDEEHPEMTCWQTHYKLPASVMHRMMR